MIEQLSQQLINNFNYPPHPFLPTMAYPQTVDNGYLHPQVCAFCEKEFPDALSYSTHLEVHANYGDQEEPYKCDQCGKCFAVPARLTRHYRIHTGEKPYSCDVCHKSFSVKENLSVHRRIHTQERPYKCTVCDRSFEHSGKLHRHMRIHTGERPHSCSVCSKTFIQSGQLVIHMRTHTGEKPYVCTTCNKGFTCSKQLKVHIRTHTGEKPYNCEICGKSFGYNHVLKLHQVAHFGEKVYKCTLCKTTFGNKKNLETHIKSHHEGNHPEQMSPASWLGPESPSEPQDYSTSMYPQDYSMRTSPKPDYFSEPESTSSSTSDKENFNFHPAHYHNISTIALLPSINTICPGNVPDLLPTYPSRPLLTPKTTNPGKTQKVIHNIDLTPVTAPLIRHLMQLDAAQYGPPYPTPPTSPSSLPLNVKGEEPLSPPTTPSPHSPSISSRLDSTLPLRKRRLAHSFSDSDSTGCPSPKLDCPTPPSSLILTPTVPVRKSCIQFVGKPKSFL